MKKLPQQLTFTDITLAAINGGIFGFLTPFVAQNIRPDLILPHPLILMLAFALLAAFGLAIGALLSRWIPFLFQLAKFGIIGVANTAVDFGVLNLLMIHYPLDPTNNEQYILYKTISFTTAVINSYFWNKFWTFHKNDTKNAQHEFAQFLMVSFTGAIINVLIATVIKNIFIETGANIAANIGAIFATITVLAWNFLGYKFFVFKK